MKLKSSLLGVLKMATIVAFASCLVGCTPAKGAGMSIGKVDTAALLAEDPDYQELSLAYVKEQTTLKKSFVERFEAINTEEDKVKALQEEYMKAQKGFDEKWKAKTDEFLKTRHENIQATAATIAERKNIDLIVIDSKMYPTVEFGGVDMTKDMALAMSEGSQKQATASATPEGKKD